MFHTFGSSSRKKKGLEVREAWIGKLHMKVVEQVRKQSTILSVISHVVSHGLR